jgi:hypothetical protein
MSIIYDIVMIINRVGGHKVADYRKLDAGSYDEAKAQLQPGEELVVSGPTGDGQPKNGHVPVTSERSYDVMTGNGNPHGEPHARTA